MKNKLGILCVLLGVLLIFGAGGLYFHNAQLQRQAGESAAQVMPQIVENIRIRHTEPAAQPDTPPVVTQALKTQMPVVEVDGNDYIGFVGIPALSLELPVMADWSYPQLEQSPCRFTGDMYSDDLVVMAHNYNTHFGGLERLREGDTVTFTDMDGDTRTYSVVATDILSPNAVEKMTAGEYDLTLFTCTYGGQSRVTVRCDEI